MQTAVLSFHNVTFGYDSRHLILQDVGFALQPGRITAILGPNGAGKTTLLHLTLGYLHPQNGEIRLQGIPLTRIPRHERGKNLALVPQSEYTPFDYSVFEYVLMGRAPHLPPLGVPGEEDYRAAWHALTQVGLETLAEQPVPQLSGGERQLMLLARALAQSPRLLLLDEPTAHLDLHNKSRLIDLLRALRARGDTLLMTNHEPDVVLALADDVLLLSPDGSAQFGPLDKIFTAEALSRIYGIPIRLVQTNGHRQVLWT